MASVIIMLVMVKRKSIYSNGGKCNRDLVMLGSCIYLYVFTIYFLEQSPLFYIGCIYNMLKFLLKPLTLVLQTLT